DVIPGKALLIVEREGRFRALFGRERRQKLPRRVGSGGTGPFLAHDAGTAQQQRKTHHQTCRFGDGKCFPHMRPANTSAGWTARRSVFWAICSRQLNPPVTITVPGAAARTAGSSARSPSVLDTSALFFSNPNGPAMPQQP